MDTESANQTLVDSTVLYSCTINDFRLANQMRRLSFYEWLSMLEHVFTSLLSYMRQVKVSHTHMTSLTLTFFYRQLLHRSCWSVKKLPVLFLFLSRRSLNLSLLLSYKKNPNHLLQLKSHLFWMGLLARREKNTWTSS